VKAPEPKAARPRDARPAPAGEAGAKKTRSEARAERRAAAPALAAAYARYQGALGLPEEQADLLSGDAGVSAYFDAAVAAYPGSAATVAAGKAAASIARWLLNDLLGLAGDRPLADLPLPGAAFGAFAALVDAGRLTPAAGKALLADLAASGGEPAARMKALGLEKVEDAGAVDAAVDRALQAAAAEVARYRAGEKKLFGVILGAAMREAKGADAALVRARLQARLG
jgi:Asp-tRNA(Asn)/Glu-tRNA(Gln) amidotransferase B subunit